MKRFIRIFLLLSIISFFAAPIVYAQDNPTNPPKPADLKAVARNWELKVEKLVAKELPGKSYADVKDIRAKKDCNSPMCDTYTVSFVDNKTGNTTKIMEVTIANPADDPTATDDDGDGVAEPVSLSKVGDVFDETRYLTASDNSGNLTTIILATYNGDGSIKTIKSFKSLSGDSFALDSGKIMLTRSGAEDNPYELTIDDKNVLQGFPGDKPTTTCDPVEQKYSYTNSKGTHVIRVTPKAGADFTYFDIDQYKADKDKAEKDKVVGLAGGFAKDSKIEVNENGELVITEGALTCDVFFGAGGLAGGLYLPIYPHKSYFPKAITTELADPIDGCAAIQKTLPMSHLDQPSSGPRFPESTIMVTVTLTQKGVQTATCTTIDPKEKDLVSCSVAGGKILITIGLVEEVDGVKQPPINETHQVFLGTSACRLGPQ